MYKMAVVWAGGGCSLVNHMTIQADKTKIAKTLGVANTTVPSHS